MKMPWKRLKAKLCSPLIKLRNNLSTLIFFH
jgi:hypothetical protein